MVIQLGMVPNRIDLLAGVSGVTFEEVWAGREVGHLSEVETNIMSREHSIKSKRATNREKGRGDVELLEKTKL